MSEVTANKRIVKNTIMLYMRMVLIMIVQLYVSRVVLGALGVNDFGLYSVVGSVVTFFGFLNTSMAAAAQRFLAFEKGKQNVERLNSTFNSIIVVQLLIAFVILLLCETLGVFYINHYLNVEPSKVTSAHIVFQVSVVSFLVNTLAVPYLASIIANERMDVFAMFSIFDAALKLSVAFMLPLFEQHRLIVYSLLLLLGVIVIQFCYMLYCRLNFEECKIKRNACKSIIKDILCYSGWNLLGSFSSVGINQGLNMILNSFFGVAVNAARGIAYQVTAAMDQLYSNFQQALNPQIVKSYASNERERMYTLITQGTRLSFFLLFVFSLPIMYNMGPVLKLWLGQVPDYTEKFCILVMCNSLIGTLSQSLLMGAMATGKIKKYQIIVSSITLLNIPLSILGLYLIPNPYLTVYIMIMLSVIAFIARLILVHQMIGLSIVDFIKRTIIPIFSAVICSVFLCSVVNIYLPTSEIFIKLFFRIGILVAICFINILAFGVSKNERHMAVNFIKSKFRR